MAGEFDILQNDRNGRPVLWKCRQCHAHIRDQTKPRGHICPVPQSHPANPLNQGRHSASPGSISSNQGPGVPISPSQSLSGGGQPGQQRHPLHGYPFTPTNRGIHFDASQPPSIVSQSQSEGRLPQNPHQQNYPPQFEPQMWQQWQSMQEQRFREQQEMMKHQQELMRQQQEQQR